MKALFFLLVAAVIYVQCNGQFTDMCLPQLMREVPVTLQMKNAPADLSACNEDGLLAIPELAALAEQQIVNQYQQSFSCRLVSLNHTACKTIGDRVLLYYMANLTCGGDSCYHLSLHDRKNKNAIKFYSSLASHLRVAYRTKSQSNFTYNNILVEIYYFRGKKGDFHFNCSGRMIEDGVKRKIPACRCPSSCADPCELPSKTGRCRGYFPNFYHNAMSGQCERFVYGGCEGNQNNFITQDECETACNVCPEGMVYQECGTACPTTCDNKDDTLFCTLQCVQGCFCEEGTVLLEEDGDVCVAHEQCPGTEPQCPEGMVYRECGTACPTTCDNKDDLVICTLQCVSGCFCNGSTVLLNGRNSTQCVAPENCPVKPPVQECPAGKVYKECGTACPLTCENKDRNITCLAQCVAGCFCPTGYVEKGDLCVRPEECDLDICSLSPKTGPCRGYFPRYFHNSTSGECEQFVYGGCQGNSNNFHTVEQCESACEDEAVETECPAGKVNKECGTACPLTCENKDKNITCTRQCVAGCFCPAGYAEKGDLCVRPDECDLDICSLPPDSGVCFAYFPRYFHNSTSGECEQFIYGGCQGNSNNFHTVEQCESACKAMETDCPDGMVYKECGTACPKTCDNKDEMVPCTRQCVQGCFCSGDTVLLKADGEKCVTEDECPTV